MLWAKPLHFLCCFKRGSGTKLIKLHLGVKIGAAAQLCALKNLVTAILPFVFVPYSLLMSQLQEVFSQSVVFPIVFFNITVFNTLIMIFPILALANN